MHAMSIRLILLIASSSSTYIQCYKQKYCTLFNGWLFADVTISQGHLGVKLVEFLLSISPAVYGFSKTRNDGIFRGTFCGTFFKNFKSGSKLSKYTYVTVISYLGQYFSRCDFFWKTRNFKRNSAEFI